MNYLAALRYALPALAGAVLSLGVFSAWDRLIDDPRVRKEARQEYVHIAEKEALQAELEREKELRTIAELVRAGYARLLAEYEARQVAENERIEKEIAEYEAELEAAGRSCRLTDADIEWLRKP